MEPLLVQVFALNIEDAHLVILKLFIKGGTTGPYTCGYWLCDLAVGDLEMGSIPYFVHNNLTH